MKRFDLTELKNYNKMLEVVNAIHSEAKDCEIIINMETVNISELSEFVKELITANNLNCESYSVTFRSEDVGSLLDIFNKDGIYGFNIPLITVARAHLNAKLIAIGTRISEWPDALMTDIEMFKLLEELADALGIDSVKRTFTTEEIQQQEDVFSFWAEETDLTQHITRACSLYLPSNGFRRESGMARAFAAYAILAHRDLNKNTGV